MVLSQLSSSTDRMIKHLKGLLGNWNLLQVFQDRITEKKERLRSTHYNEVVQAFKNASRKDVKFWELQMNFRAEGVTLYSVARSADL